MLTTPRVKAPEQAAASHPQYRAQLGLSVIEVLIATAVMMVIALGLLPLYTLSINNNTQGRRATEATNLARSDVERILQLPFNAPELLIPVGDTELVTEAWYDPLTSEWVGEDDYTPGDPWLYHRIITIRQFNLDALRNDPVNQQQLDADEALDGGTPQPVHFKEIMVEIESASNMTSVGKELTIRTLKAA